MVMASIDEMEARDVDNSTDIAYEEISKFEQILHEAEEEKGADVEEEYETVTVTMKTYSVLQVK